MEPIYIDLEIVLFRLLIWQLGMNAKLLCYAMSHCVCQFSIGIFVHHIIWEVIAFTKHHQRILFQVTGFSILWAFGAGNFLVLKYNIQHGHVHMYSVCWPQIQAMYSQHTCEKILATGLTTWNINQFTDFSILDMYSHYWF